MWNSLPNGDVHAEPTNVFKIKLDKFWSNQEIIYDYHMCQNSRNRKSKCILVVIVSKLLHHTF